MHKIRVYHAALAVLTILAYLSGDFGLAHDWLGYVVAAIICFRLLWALFNPRQLGPIRFYSEFNGLRFDNAYRHPAVSKALTLGIAVSLIGATLTGVAMDGGLAIGFAGFSAVAPAHANRDAGERHGNDDGNEFLEEINASLSSLVIRFVILRATYLLFFKRPLARCILYQDRRKGSHLPGKSRGREPTP